MPAGKFQGSWTDPEAPFCESELMGTPEILNTITSAVILAASLEISFTSIHSNIYLKTIYGCTATVGGGSIFFHATLYRGWGLMDAFPMLVSMYLLIYLSVDITLYKFFHQFYENPDFYDIVSGCLSLFLLPTCFVSLVNTAIYGQQNGTFYASFALPGLFLVISMLLNRFLVYRAYKAEPHFARAFNHMYYALASACVAGTVWMGTELSCNHVRWMRYVPGHALWHICVSYAIYSIAQYLVFLHLVNKDRDPIFKTSKNRYLAYFYAIVPHVVTRKRRGYNLIDKIAEHGISAITLDDFSVDRSSRNKMQGGMAGAAASGSALTVPSSARARLLVNTPETLKQQTSESIPYVHTQSPEPPLKTRYQNGSIVLGRPKKASIIKKQISEFGSEDDDLPVSDLAVDDIVNALPDLSGDSEEDDDYGDEHKEAFDGRTP